MLNPLTATPEVYLEHFKAQQKSVVVKIALFCLVGLAIAIAALSGHIFTGANKWIVVGSFATALGVFGVPYFASLYFGKQDPLKQQYQSDDDRLFRKLCYVFVVGFAAALLSFAYIYNPAVKVHAALTGAALAIEALFLAEIAFHHLFPDKKIEVRKIS